MNRHYILTLLDETVKTVACKFRDGFKPYTYKTRLDLAAGDFVVVDTPSNGLQVVQVVTPHELPELDPNSSTDYKWVLCKVDLEAYKAQVANDEATFKKVHTARIAEHRRQVKAALIAELPFLEAMAGQTNTLQPAAPIQPGVVYESNHKTAEQLGFSDYEQGARPEDNPYKDGSQLSEQWIVGYRKAATTARNRCVTPGMANVQA